MKRTLKIGTRGSKMALVQTAMVADALAKEHPGLAVVTKIIKTKGDRDMAPIPLDTVGKDWFTKEIEVALLDGEIDLAVHSLKDLSPELPAGLAMQSVFARDDARDVLVPRTAGMQLADLSHGATVGTDSLRRKANLLRLRPDLVVRSVRGNVQTRLQRLADGAYDALVLAAAGLERLGELNVVSEWFPIETFVPAIGQGVLAVEFRSSDSEVERMVQPLCDELTGAAVLAEQAFSAEVGGGCKLPVGCYAAFVGEEVVIHGMLGTDEGTHAVVCASRGPAATAPALARTLAAALRQALASA